MFDYKKQIGIISSIGMLSLFLFFYTKSSNNKTSEELEKETAVTTSKEKVSKEPITEKVPKGEKAESKIESDKDVAKLVKKYKEKIIQETLLTTEGKIVQETEAKKAIKVYDISIEKTINELSTSELKKAFLIFFRKMKNHVFQNLN